MRALVAFSCSDAFLFGARHVYKNIFRSNKYVEAYKTPDIMAETGYGRCVLNHRASCEGVSVHSQSACQA